MAMSACAICGELSEDVKVTEYFNCFAVALCTECYSKWVQHYYTIEDFRLYRISVLRFRTLEAWMMNNPRTDELMTELCTLDMCVYAIELKLANMATSYFRARKNS